MDNVSYWETSFIKSLKVEILQWKALKRDFKLRSLEMLAHRETDNPNFSFAQECSNDYVPFLHSISLFIEGMGVHKMP